MGKRHTELLEKLKEKSRVCIQSFANNEEQLECYLQALGEQKDCHLRT